MRRNLLVGLVICGATICGGCRGPSNNYSLFSPQSTRVPAPGTKSFGVADSNYYSKPSPAGLPAIGTGSSLPPPSSSELAWQPPRAKTAGGRAALASNGETVGDGVEPASFSPPSSSMRLAGMKASEAKPPAGPPRATDAEPPIEITELPPAAAGSSPKPYRPGSTGLAPAGPEPSASPPNNLRWRNRS